MFASCILDFSKCFLLLDLFGCERVDLLLHLLLFFKLTLSSSFRWGAGVVLSIELFDWSANSPQQRQHRSSS